MKSEYNGGFIKLYRNLFLWDWWSDIRTFRLWIVILRSVNWQDNEWQGKTIRRGSMVTSLEKLSELSQLTIQQTRTALNHLKKTNDITIKSTKNGSVITVVNYDFWQGRLEESTHELTNETTSELTSEATNRPTTNKESKTIKKEKNDKNNSGADSTELLEMLTPEELHELYEQFENAYDLIDQVQELIDTNHTVVNSAYSYICGYAKNVNWRTN